jgi:hypothetical protein
MKKEMMIRSALIVSVALLSAACINKDGPTSQYELNILVPGEPSTLSEWNVIEAEYFNRGADSVAVREYLEIGPVALCSTLDSKGGLVGGFALCTGADTLDTPDRAPARFAVFDHNGNEKSLLYTVYHDTLSAPMPKHSVLIGIPNTDSSCQPVSVYVQNVHAVVQAVRHGIGLAGGPFGADDHLTLTITGSYDGKVTGEKSVKLVDGTKLLGEWTEVDLSKLGNVDALDLKLTSSRPDLPLYCAVDDLIFHYHAIYY